jgi:serine/threonine protein phosphatase PrpC
MEKAARALVAAANARGGEDNITVALLRFEA